MSRVAAKSRETQAREGQRLARERGSPPAPQCRIAQLRSARGDRALSVPLAPLVELSELPFIEPPLARLEELSPVELIDEPFVDEFDIPPFAELDVPLTGPLAFMPPLELLELLTPVPLEPLDPVPFVEPLPVPPVPVPLPLPLPPAPPLCARAAPPAMPMAPTASAVSFKIAFIIHLLIGWLNPRWVDTPLPARPMPSTVWNDEVVIYGMGYDGS
jgi:hypothetical protein